MDAVAPRNDEIHAFKDNIIHNVVNPLVSGIAFGAAWLGTFYLLKQKFT
jgi:hypothetical protein